MTNTYIFPVRTPRCGPLNLEAWSDLTCSNTGPWSRSLGQGTLVLLAFSAWGEGAAGTGKGCSSLQRVGGGGGMTTHLTE